MTQADSRLKLVRTIRARPHRYHRARVWTMGLSLVLLAAVPIAGLARFDLWGGNSVALGAPVGVARGLFAVLAAIAGFYLLTFVLNAFAGRMFCGWGCPVGQLSRLADSVDAARKDRGRRWLALVGFAFALSVAVALWWVDPRIAVGGSAQALAVAGASLLALTGLAVLHGMKWRWRFCTHFCPIGIYYTIVQFGASVGIKFETDNPHCIDCGACQKICPVGLEPRRLDEVQHGIKGIAVDSFPGNSYCLVCGECAEICDVVTRDKRAPLHL